MASSTAAGTLRMVHDTRAAAGFTAFMFLVVVSALIQIGLHQIWKSCVQPLEKLSESETKLTWSQSNWPALHSLMNKFSHWVQKKFGGCVLVKPYAAVLSNRIWWLVRIVFTPPLFYCDWTAWPKDGLQPEKQTPSVSSHCCCFEHNWKTLCF